MSFEQFLLYLNLWLILAFSQSLKATKFRTGLLVYMQRLQDYHVFLKCD